MQKNLIAISRNQEADESSNSPIRNGPVRDDRERVKLVEEFLGRENLIRTGSGVWHFNAEVGVWVPLDAQELEANTMRVLELHGQPVNAAVVSSAVRVFVSYDYQKNFDFDRGDRNIVVNKDGYWHFADGQWVLSEAQRELYRRTALPFRRIELEPLAFEAFLDSIFATKDDVPLTDAEQLKLLVYEVIGACMVTHTHWEKAFMFVGPGANGKSVLGAVLRSIIGATNTAAVPPKRFSEKFQVSHLEGKLLNLVTELDQSERIPDGSLKALVSGETITVENKHCNPREIRPIATHVFLTNHLPRLRDHSDGLFRRIIVIPMRRQFLEEAADPNLLQKLSAEVDAIGSRAMDALGGLIERGGRFTSCQTIETAHREWRKENNTVALYADTRLCRTNPDEGHSLRLQVAYADYSVWCQSNGHARAVANGEFRKRLENLGFNFKRRNNGFVILDVQQA
jgi:putative DNA primase/helicase